MQVRDVELALVREILARMLPGVPVFAFGSRVKSAPVRRDSDLDICIRGPKRSDLGTLGNLRDAFADSALPYRVDVVDWWDMAPDFRAAVERDFVKLQ